KVLPKEGFYRLKLKLGVEQEQLEILNPGLKESGLKEGMILKIPYNATVGETSNTELQEIDLTNRIKSFNTKHLVIMLPFQLNKVRVNLKVDDYDTKNLLNEVSNILNSNEFGDVDAVIGPFMQNNIEKVASNLKAYNVPVISPITKNVTLTENVFQSRPSESLL